MGYYTKYKLTVIPAEMHENIFNRILAKLSYDPFEFEEDCKWYNPSDDMKQISLEVPDVVMTLDGRRCMEKVVSKRRNCFMLGYAKDCTSGTRRRDRKTGDGKLQRSADSPTRR